jgi:hypothetical protein
MRQRFAQHAGTDPATVQAPAWRPFQLAFILQTLPGLVDPSKADREIVDLLFFPTGGGKTEAYLGLAATAIVLRSLAHRDDKGKPTALGCGVSVLMRYTLRLLTLDQLGRAAGLICALELERKEAPDRLGDWPFEIGLWVGSAATPNTMGGPNDKSSGRRYTAYTRWLAFREGKGNAPSPIPLEECPWCGTSFKPECFDLVPSQRNPQDLRIHCCNHKCAFTGDAPLPIVAVDEPLYTRLPAFLIATVDKFAALPWNQRSNLRTWNSAMTTCVRWHVFHCDMACRFVVNRSTKTTGDSTQGFTTTRRLAHHAF